MSAQAQRASGRFFVRIGQVGRATETRDPYTRQLFPLPVLIDAEGLLAPDARHLARSSDPDTSRAAAARAKTIIGEHERVILAAICNAGARGACSKEIARVTELTHVQVDRRLHAIPGIERRLRKDATGPKDYERRQGCAVWWAK